MTPDMVNELFEFVGGLFLCLNCWRIHKDKQLKGVSFWSVFFFTSWNLFFYPSMEAYYSFYGGILIALANTVWIGLVIYYKVHKPASPKDWVKLAPRAPEPIVVCPRSLLVYYA
jgi:hypothetical protein